MPLPAAIRFYDSPRAPNPRRVRIFMAEKGIQLPTTAINIMAGEHFAALYRDKVQTHHVPALELDDGTVFTETVAICRYLEALYPEKNLMGEGALEQAKIEMWSRRIEFQLLMPVAAVARHTIPAMAVLEQQCAEWGRANISRVSSGLDWLDRVLSQSNYVAGDRFTLADITAITTVDFMRLIKVKPLSTQVNILKWADRVRARPTIVE